MCYNQAGMGRSSMTYLRASVSSQVFLEASCSSKAMHLSTRSFFSASNFLKSSSARLQKCLMLLFSRRPTQSVMLAALERYPAAFFCASSRSLAGLEAVSEESVQTLISFLTSPSRRQSRARVSSLSTSSLSRLSSSFFTSQGVLRLRCCAIPSTSFSIPAKSGTTNSSTIASKKSSWYSQILLASRRQKQSDLQSRASRFSLPHSLSSSSQIRSSLRALAGSPQIASSASRPRRPAYRLSSSKLISTNTTRFTFGSAFPSRPENSCSSGQDCTAGMAWRVETTVLRLCPRMPSGSSCKILMKVEQVFASLPMERSRESWMELRIVATKAVAIVLKKLSSSSSPAMASASFSSRPFSSSTLSSPFSCFPTTARSFARTATRAGPTLSALLSRLSGSSLGRLCEI